MLYNLLDADANPDLAFHFDADANPDPDRASQKDTDPQLLRNVEEFSLFYSVLLGAAESGPQRQDVQVKKEETQEEREAESAAHGGGHEARHGGKGNLHTYKRIQCCVFGPNPKSDSSSLSLVFLGQKNLILSTNSILLTSYNHMIGINPLYHYQCYGPVTFFCTVPLTNGSESYYFRHLSVRH
jgi:hypothetical protein